MWKVYRWNGHYIIGDLVSKHSSESAALKKAKKEVGHKRTEREESKDEVIIWLDSEDGIPMGAIVKKKRSKNV